MKRKEERSKQGQTNNKAKQHNTPKVVTFPKKSELPQVGLESMTPYTLDRHCYQDSSAGWAQISHFIVHLMNKAHYMYEYKYPTLNKSKTSKQKLKRSSWLIEKKTASTALKMRASIIIWLRNNYSKNYLQCIHSYESKHSHYMIQCVLAEWDTKGDIHVLMRDEKEGRKKQARSNKTTRQIKQHNTPKVVTFPKKSEHVRINLHILTPFHNCRVH